MICPQLISASQIKTNNNEGLGFHRCCTLHCSLFVSVTLIQWPNFPSNPTGGNRGVINCHPAPVQLLSKTVPESSYIKASKFSSFVHFPRKILFECDLSSSQGLIPKGISNIAQVDQPQGQSTDYTFWVESTQGEPCLSKDVSFIFGKLTQYQETVIERWQLLKIELCLWNCTTWY